MDYIKKNTINTWGQEFKKKIKIFYPYDKISLVKNFKNRNIAFSGNYRSYGDSCIGKNIINSKNFNKIISFNEKLGILKVQSGVKLSEIIDLIVPKGWFLKVTPGTKYATVGGCISSDVHGKEHHKSGCFSDHVIEIVLVTSVGKIITCSKTKNKELFKAVCGGMGLVGFILTVEFKLKKINSVYVQKKVQTNLNLKDLFKCFEKHKKFNYSVAWIDGRKKNNDFRSVFYYGNFDKKKNLKLNKKIWKIKIPFKIKIVNNFTISLLNNLVFYKNKFIKKKKIYFDKFFYPLDNIQNWNNLYGKSGMLQYQFILPKINGSEGICEILELLNLYRVYPSLAVLKLHGPANNNFITFPMSGYSLALDFNNSTRVKEILKKIDKIVIKYNGRIYLSKDSTMSEKVFKKTYSKLNSFLKIRNKYQGKNFVSQQFIRLGI